MEFYQTDYESDNSISSNDISGSQFSFVWRYFRSIKDSDSVECKFCKNCIGNQETNLARHLRSTHNITRQSEIATDVETPLKRPYRSFIWKYCSKEDQNHVRCHLCKKLLFAGGGNTSNISKHLRRKHMDIIDIKKNESIADIMETNQAITSINENGTEIKVTAPERKERKGSSYVWKYSQKISRNVVRCNLCHKDMSFHGTANVITHLQRKHNILGKANDDNEDLNLSFKSSSLKNNSDSEETQKSTQHMLMNDAEPESHFNRKSITAVSNVWKYCTRISLNVVRCTFCKKNLSYQGTSNLQRHLHRMHNVVTQGRNVQDTLNDPCDSNSSEVNIWEYCKTVGEDKIKCTMCSTLFDRNNLHEITKHITFTHAIGPRRPPISTKRHRDYKDDTSEDSDDYSQDDWTKHDLVEEIPPQMTECSESDIKKDEELYDDIIVEEPDQINTYDEDPFDPSMVKEFPIANPLSPQSSNEDSPEFVRKPVKINSKKLQKLNEERVRMETEYFHAKAGFYRMQKYLTALQARKVRMEIERFNSTDLNGPYTINLDVPQNMVSQ